MFFIRKQRNSKDSLAPDVHQQFLKGCETYIGRLKAEGRLISAQPIDWQGNIISGRPGDWEGVPFDESGEVIGGYYHIRAQSLDEAISIAQENPEFIYNTGTRIEVRPIKMKEESTGFEYPTAAVGL